MSLDLQLSHSFEEFALDVEFSAKSGVTALFGPSGAGKSTIANAIAGLLQPKRGRIVLQGRVLFDAAAAQSLPPSKRRVGYVFQDGRLFPHMSVEGNIRFGIRFAPNGLNQKEIARVVKMLAIDHIMQRRPRNLSGGEQQRVALARALLSQPDLLLMDEPLAALDEPRKDEILPYLERLRDHAKVPIIYVSHSLGEVARLADDLIVLKDGKVVSAGSTELVLSDPVTLPYVGVREAGSVLRAKVIEHAPDGLSRLEMSGGELVLPGVEANPGTWLRIRVLAQDVLLSLHRPVGLSSRNIIAVQIREIHKGAGPGVAVQLQAGDDRILARITERAMEDLGIVPGLECYAILKATAVARGSIGTSRTSN